MRKSLLLLAGLGLTLPTLAQTERGAKLIGVSVGDLRYANYKTRNARELSAAVYPSLGWFVHDRLALGSGLLLIYEHDKSKSDNVYLGYPTRSSGHVLGIGVAPFARYYFYDGTPHKIFGQAGVELASYFSSSTYNDGNRGYTSKDSGTRTGWYANVGYNYFLSPSVALEATAGYRRGAFFDYAPQRFGNTFPAENGLDVRLGFSFFLPAAKVAAVD
ncbi:outer membrane beta-barrel protein [Hymenobacter sp. 15J16-1T3B]|uniref:outer membrane beta-barrel protein n=1 Tax=Hymenobacter sp. 15J16-1T3B TaxID=2886941 RepID=UPI001D0FF6B2|nr:outer membrane beta-barrel protein [Hymenobacter sp. 15J16-1T3B]MCC3155854.1 outer membrane beta-barrel protein [Hymenobacter sp. 15J16-1T3B]